MSWRRLSLGGIHSGRGSLTPAELTQRQIFNAGFRHRRRGRQTRITDFGISTLFSILVAVSKHFSSADVHYCVFFRRSKARFSVGAERDRASRNAFSEFRFYC